MQTVKTILLLLVCTAILGACGLRGPLYLPDENQAAKPTVEQDKDDEKDEKKKSDSG